ncbi:hypothetical protein RUM44_010421 [Polyplax serrata]|uniref:Uncharacterized protein n=1 Tax=Polyplax serrata TaxID=468196 RepID=A0ABR1AVH3_POLSC
MSETEVFAMVLMTGKHVIINILYRDKSLALLEPDMGHKSQIILLLRACRQMTSQQVGRTPFKPTCPGDNVDCWMEIQHGKGPWAPPVSGIVPLGSTLTLVVAINDYRVCTSEVIRTTLPAR